MPDVPPKRGRHDQVSISRRAPRVHELESGPQSGQPRISAVGRSKDFASEMPLRSLIEELWQAKTAEVSESAMRSLTLMNLAEPRVLGRATQDPDTDTDQTDNTAKIRQSTRVSDTIVPEAVDGLSDDSATPSTERMFISGQRPELELRARLLSKIETLDYEGLLRVDRFVRATEDLAAASGQSNGIAATFEVVVRSSTSAPVLQHRRTMRNRSEPEWPEERFDSLSGESVLAFVARAWRPLFQSGRARLSDLKKHDPAAFEAIIWPDQKYKKEKAAGNVRDIVQFLEDYWADLISIGVVDSAVLTEHDEDAMRAIRNYERRKTLPQEIRVPKVGERVDAALLEATKLDRPLDSRLQAAKTRRLQKRSPN